MTNSLDEKVGLVKCLYCVFHVYLSKSVAYVLISSLILCAYFIIDFMKHDKSFFSRKNVSRSQAISDKRPHRISHPTNYFFDM